MLIINYISCNYLIQTTEQLKQTPIARGIHIQNISMTKGKKSEKQKKRQKSKKKKNEPSKNEKRKKEKKQTNKTNKKQPPTYI